MEYIRSFNQVTESTTLYCILKVYTHASLERDSIFKLQLDHGQKLLVLIYSELAYVPGESNEAKSLNLYSVIKITTRGTKIN